MVELYSENQLKLMYLLGYHRMDTTKVYTASIIDFMHVNASQR